MNIFDTIKIINPSYEFFNKTYNFNNLSNITCNIFNNVCFKDGSNLFLQDRLTFSNFVINAVNYSVGSYDFKWNEIRTTNFNFRIDSQSNFINFKDKYFEILTNNFYQNFDTINCTSLTNLNNNEKDTVLYVGERIKTLTLNNSGSIVYINGTYSLKTLCSFKAKTDFVLVLGHDSTPINNFSPSLINFVKCSGEIRYRYLNGQIPDDVLVKYFNCFKEFHFTGNGSYEGFASGDSSTKNVIWALNSTKDDIPFLNLSLFFSYDKTGISWSLVNAMGHTDGYEYFSGTITLYSLNMEENI